MKNAIDLSGMETTIEKVNEQSLGEVRTIGSKEVGSTPEEKAQREEELNEAIKEQATKKARLALIKTFKTQLLQIKSELDNGKTFDDVLNEINEKKSRLSRSTRDFCLNFKKEAILGFLKDLEDLTNGKFKI